MYKLKDNRLKPPKSRKRLLAIISIAAVVLLGITFIILEKTGTTDLVHIDKKVKPIQQGGPTGSTADNSKGESKDTGTQDTDTSRPEDEKPQGNTADPNTPLVTPSGTFVSNHKAKKSEPGRAAMTSTCTTTSGATCDIIFTKGNETKSLGAQTADREGSVYWSWNVNDLGLSAGTWHVQAKAVLGSQTKTADDATNLEVEP
jgi:hypothetical protein